jgi:hypothetical protein
VNLEPSHAENCYWPKNYPGVGRAITIRIQMDFLIRLIGRALARRIQAGSAIGAFVGTLFGALAGIVSAYLLLHFEMIDRDFAIAIYLILSIPLAILGALLGSAVGPTRAAADAKYRIKLTQYNRAVGTLAIALIFLALTVALIVAPDGKSKAEVTPKWEIVGITVAAGISFAGAAFVGARQVWYIELNSGSNIVIRRLLGIHSYSRQDIRMWGFEIQPNEVVQRAFIGATNFCVQFDDGFTYRINARGEDSQSIVDILKIE